MGLIKKGLAYVCQLTPEEFKEYRGSIGVPAKSPYRDRPIEELSLIHIFLASWDLPDLTYLAAGHHGSKYSTGETLLQALTPETVSSAGWP